MRPALTFAIAIAICSLVRVDGFAQTLARTPAPPSDTAQLEALTKKIDEQNAKIDMLSQQILKLQQQLASSRPGVMIGEGGASPSPAASAASAGSPTPGTAASSSPNGNAHVVARGETLTSIAKAHNVSVSDLQKFNHIDNPLKLQAGQTIMIPAPAAPGASASPAE